jgi:hypothetical protein
MVGPIRTVFTLASTMRARVAVVVVSLAWLSACTGASPSATPGGSGNALPQSACPAIDLKTPAGDDLNLTGRWRGRDGATYYLRQSASCLWITGFSADTGSPGGEGATDYTNAFFGHLAADFTFSGFWADMPWGREVGVGTVTWQVDFADVGGISAVTLSVVEASNGGSLTLVEPDDQDLTLRVSLQDNDVCPIVESDDGEEYELLVAEPGWELLTPTELVPPSGIVILAGETFEISGEVALGDGACGPGQIFIADRIEPGPTP